MVPILQNRLWVCKYIVFWICFPCFLPSFFHLSFFAHSICWKLLFCAKYLLLFPCLLYCFFGSWIFVVLIELRRIRYFLIEALFLILNIYSLQRVPLVLIVALFLGCAGYGYPCSPNNNVVELTSPTWGFLTYWQIIAGLQCSWTLLCSFIWYLGYVQLLKTFPNATKYLKS